MRFKKELVVPEQPANDDSGEQINTIGVNAMGMGAVYLLVSGAVTSRFALGHGDILTILSIDECRTLAGMLAEACEAAALPCLALVGGDHAEA